VENKKTEIISNYTGVKEQTLTSSVNVLGLVCMECEAIKFGKCIFLKFWVIYLSIKNIIKKSFNFKIINQLLIPN
jgi:hypothetical protein